MKTTIFVLMTLLAGIVLAESPNTYRSGGIYSKYGRNMGRYVERTNSANKIVEIHDRSGNITTYKSALPYYGRNLPASGKIGNSRSGPTISHGGFGSVVK
jgi:hypothetical protein